MSAATLPPLPQCTYLVDTEAKRHGMHPAYRNLQNVMKYGGEGAFEQMFSADQMNAYARAALAAKPPDAGNALSHPAAALLEVPQAPAGALSDEPIQEPLLWYDDDGERFEFDDLDRELLAKCREGVAYIENGDPLKDALDWDDIENAIRLLVALAAPPVDMPAVSMGAQEKNDG